MDDVIKQNRDVMPSAWVPKGGVVEAGAWERGPCQGLPRGAGDRCEGREEDP